MTLNSLNAQRFRRTFSSGPITEQMVELERHFTCLCATHQQGASYRDAESRVQEVLAHPATLELCRTATLAATRPFAQAEQHHGDVFQAALLRLLQKIRADFDRTAAGDGVGPWPPLLGYRPDRGSGEFPFLGWFYRILRNACLSACRDLFRHQYRFAWGSEGLGSIPEQPRRVREPDEAELADAVRAALAALDEDGRRVVTGLMEGKKGTQIAEELGRSSAWVTNHKKRATQQLRQLLNATEVP